MKRGSVKKKKRGSVNSQLRNVYSQSRSPNPELSLWGHRTLWYLLLASNNIFPNPKLS